MLKTLAISACLLAPAAAQAFTQCAVTPLTGPEGEIAEEGSNPVASDNWVYSGYIDGNKVGVVVSSDAGKTLNPPVILDAQNVAHYVRLAASGANVYATWRARAKGGWHIFFDASRAHGAAGSWDKPKDLGPLSTNLTQIAASGSYVYIAYLGTDGNVAVLASKDAGKTFSAPAVAGAGWGEIVLTALNDHVYASWQLQLGRNDFDVMVAASGDAGATFKTQNLSTGRPVGGVEPIFSLDAASGRVSLVWRDIDSTSTGYYVRTTDGGQTWSTPLAVDNASRQFMVADDGGTIYVSYLKQIVIDGVPDWQVQVATSTDGGSSFPTKQNLTGMTGIAKIVGDDFRPIPWVRGERAYRLTGVKADGVYMWNGNNGRMSGAAFLGPGYLAAPALNSAVWLNTNGVVSYGVCK